MSLKFDNGTEIDLNFPFLRVEKAEGQLLVVGKGHAFPVASLEDAGDIIMEEICLKSSVLWGRDVETQTVIFIKLP